MSQEQQISISTEQVWKLEIISINILEQQRPEQSSFAPFFTTSIFPSNYSNHKQTRLQSKTLEQTPNKSLSRPLTSSACFTKYAAFLPKSAYDRSPPGVNNDLSQFINPNEANSPHNTLKNIATMCESPSSFVVVVIINDSGSTTVHKFRSPVQRRVQRGSGRIACKC